MAVDTDRLKSILSTSGLQQSNNALYQLLNQVINILRELNTIVTITGSLANVFNSIDTINSNITGIDNTISGINDSINTINGLIVALDSTLEDVIADLIVTQSKTYLTEADETAYLTSSRMLVAGTGITFDDVVAGVRTISSEGGPAGSTTFSRGITVSGTITTGFKGVIRVPVACTIVAWTLMSDVAGNIAFDITKDAPGTTYPPTTSIVAAAPPTLTANDFNGDATLTGWTTAVDAGDVIGFTVTSVSGVGRATLQLDFEV